MIYEFYDEKYITKQGDTWESISMDFYGNPFKLKELIENNRKYSNIVIFDSNVELKIPILDGGNSETLAPWQRGD